jgi:hypothetical protein
MFSATLIVCLAMLHPSNNDTNAWHNQFQTHVVMRVNEELFAPLYSKDNMGAPNSSIKILIGMMCLKEAFGCSDKQLFERCNFDLLIRSALCLFNLNDTVPSPATYYNFRGRIVE